MEGPRTLATIAARPATRQGSARSQSSAQLSVASATVVLDTVTRLVIVTFQTLTPARDRHREISGHIAAHGEAGQQGDMIKEDTGSLSRLTQGIRAQVPLVVLRATDMVTHDRVDDEALGKVLTHQTLGCAPSRAEKITGH